MENLDTKHHPRKSPYGRFIYPVLSRRSGGLSLGINLNPDTKCNFDCVYCQVEGRGKEKNTKNAIAPQPEEDLKGMLEDILQDIEDFLTKPNPLNKHQIKDFAIAGDGEPTQSKILDQVIFGLIELKKKHQLQDTKITLFTNGAGIGAKKLTKALDALVQSQGEIWFKLDFWDEESYQRINRPKVKYQTILNNLVQVGQKYQVVLQSCFFLDRLKDSSTNWPEDWLEKYIQLVLSLLGKNVQIAKIQAYTLARTPAESWASPYSKKQMDVVAAILKAKLPDSIGLELYYDH